jgi:hypothetical protein
MFSSLIEAVLSETRIADMDAQQGCRFYRLSKEGVQCDEQGLSVGGVPLLLRSSRRGGADSWVVRPDDELNSALGNLYGLPIDIAEKRDRLAGVAKALQSGELALAKIATLLLRFPDPPSLAKSAPERGTVELATQLFDSGLFKGDWDPAKHPRREEAPNRGWFAPKEGEPEPSGAFEPKEKGELVPSQEGEIAPTQEKQPEPKPQSTRRKTSLLEPLSAAWKNMARTVIEAANFEYWLGSAAAEGANKLAEYEHVIQQAEVLIFETPREMFANYERTAEQVRASLDPPKTLEELQTPPTQNIQGYQLHHIVEQNPANLNKSPIEIFIEKFGRDLIDSPSNLVWVPRLKHELITGYYNSLEPGDDQQRLHRQVVSAMGFAEQRAAGLEAMRRFGVLK